MLLNTQLNPMSTQTEIISLIKHLCEDIDDDEVKNAIDDCICISTHKYDKDVPSTVLSIKESFMQAYSSLNDMIVIPEDLNDELNLLYETIGK